MNIILITLIRRHKHEIAKRIHISECLNLIYSNFEYISPRSFSVTSELVPSGIFDAKL